MAWFSDEERLSLISVNSPADGYDFFDPAIRQLKK